MIEIWKDIPGYEGKYQASDLGNIRSVTRSVAQMGRYGKPFTRIIKGRILKPGKQDSGHVTVALGRGNSIPVHQLVILTFKGPPPRNCEVRHLNSNPKDNSPKNLCYGTRTENILDEYRLGKKWRKLNVSQVLEIRRLLSEGIKGSEISRLFNISQSQVSNIKNGVQYKWLK
jgi:hypothetical protein